MGGNRRGRPPQTRRWHRSALLALALAAAACTDRAAPTGDGAADGNAANAETASGPPPLTRWDPAFDGGDDCALVERYYRELVRPTAPRSQAEVAAGLERQRRLLTEISTTEAVDTPTALDDAVAITDETLRLLSTSWTDDETDDLADGFDGTAFALIRRILTGPVVVDDREVAADPTEAVSMMATAADRLVLDCSNPPDAHPIPRIAADPPRPEVSFVAGRQRDGVEWLRYDLATGETGVLPVGDMVSLEIAPDGGRAIGALWPERLLHLIDPSDWSTAPIPGAGAGWSCPSWTLDGEAILGDVIDPATGDRTSMRYVLDGDGERTPLPSVVTSCPKDIGNGEITFADDDELLAVTADGDTRSLFTLGRCNLVPIHPADGGILDVYANCSNPYLDGLHRVDVTTGDSSHLIAGRVGAGDVSADGRWRLFVYAPIGEPDDELELWVLDREQNEAWSLGELLVFPQFLPS